MGIFDRAARSLKSLFGRPERSRVARAVKVPPAAQPEPPPSHRLPEGTSFEDHLEALVETRSTGTVGAIHWIGLKKFHERYSEHWNRIGPKVHAVAENCIKRRLISAEDIYERRNDDYAILFAEADHRRARLQCALIANDITEALLGEDGLADLVKVCSTAVQMDREEVRALRADGGISALLERESERHEGASVEPAYDMVPLEEALADVQCIYQPMWYSRRGVVSSYRCYPACVSEAGSLTVGELVFGPLSALTGVARPLLLPALDKLVLGQALAALGELAEANTRNVLVIPVHHLTLAAPSSVADYVSACRKMPAGFDRFIVFEIIGIDDEADHTNLFRPVMQLKPYCRAVILSQPGNRRDFSRITMTGLHSVGMTLDNVGDMNAGLVDRLEKFVAAANRHKFRTYIHGIESWGQAEAAKKAGFDYISGMTTTSLARAITRPRGVYRVTLEKLFHSEIAEEEAAPSSQPAPPAPKAPRPAEEPVELEFREEAPATRSEPPPPAAGTDISEELLLLTGQLMAEHKLPKQDAMILAKARLAAS